ncbi:DNA recombination protein RmuC [Stenoxybacter acetivorans]|uniref:DNA recombination protein RmuC n=1 Tax=Stenoxybacter acetivorans TaxID=422441 RepID=UPI00068C4188|nr:DNA recombination protein RmuC [Stenoxybacter acetivorans]
MPQFIFPLSTIIVFALLVLLVPVVYLLMRRREQRLRNDVHELETDIARRQASGEQLQDQLQSCQLQLLSVQQDLQDKNVQVTEAETENRQIAPLRQEKQQLQQEYQTLQSQFQAIQTQLTQAETTNRQIPELRQEKQQLQEAHQALLVRFQEAQSNLSSSRQQVIDWQEQESDWRVLKNDYQNLETQFNTLQVAHGRLQTQLQQERDSHQEKLALLTEARETLSNQFKVLANEILEEKGKQFGEQNKNHLETLLNPLHERVQGFSQLIQNTYEKESKERNRLETELQNLQKLNTQLHEGAQALTDALIGTQNKAQGNWGEMILETMLENSGLQKGREYFVQMSGVSTDENDEERRVQPDIVVNLPDKKHIIIDSKMSLTAYVRYTQARQPEDAERELRAHVQSVRNHIKNLAEKRYDNIKGFNTPDFVFLFIPVEPAYLVALQHEPGLFDEAFKKRIMLVGPGTLLATLRTIAHIWRSEQQNQNALKIAQAGGKLYDKFVGFVSTLESVGKNIGQAQNQYDAAIRQLQSGRGNLIRQAESLRQLGVASSRHLPEPYRNQDDDEADNQSVFVLLPSTDEFEAALRANTKTETEPDSRN